jgi:drug/metabolite transporter (DMT)-like permease
VSFREFFSFFAASICGMKNLSENHKGIFYSIVAALMWSVLAIALKVSLNRLSPGTIVCARFIVAFLFLATFLLIKRPLAFSIFRKPPLKLVIASLCLAFNYFGFMKGIQYTTPSNAQVFIQLGPVLFAVIGIYLFKEKINWKHIVGFIVLLSGLGLFFREQILALGNHGTYSLGILWVVAAAVAWAFYAVLQKDLTKNGSVNQLNLFIYGLCSVIFVPIVKYSDLVGLSFGMWMMILFLGLNTLIAYGAIALAFRYLDSSKVSVIATMNPVVTFILMFLLGKMNVSWIAPEHFSAISILGTILALGGAVFVILFTRKE